MASGWLGAGGVCHSDHSAAAMSLRAVTQPHFATEARPSGGTCVYQYSMEIVDWGEGANPEWIRKPFSPSCAGDPNDYLGQGIVVAECEYIGPDEAMYAGWGIAAAWLAVYAIRLLRRAST